MLLVAALGGLPKLFSFEGRFLLLGIAMLARDGVESLADFESWKNGWPLSAIEDIAPMAKTPCRRSLRDVGFSRTGHRACGGKVICLSATERPSDPSVMSPSLHSDDLEVLVGASRLRFALARRVDALMSAI